MKYVLGPLRDESALVNTGQIVEVLYAIVKVLWKTWARALRRRNLEGSTIYCGESKGPILSKVLRGFQDEGSSMRAHLKSFWSLMGNKLKLVVMILFLSKVGS